MSEKVHVFKDGTNLRQGGYIRRKDSDPDNVIAVIPSGFYQAHYQCGGSDVKESNGLNGDGWVSAVRIATGGDNEPIPGVETRATAFARSPVRVGHSAHPHPAEHGRHHFVSPAPSGR
jgi:hypothetical protein